jgi:predicted metal-dependent phosphoesterase TrpH
MNCDLHIHTNFSDAFVSLDEVLKSIKENNIEIFSITDHNLFEAHKLIKGNNIITGIEISVEYKEVEYHFLMYGFDINNSYMKEYEKKVRIHDIKGFMNLINTFETIYNIKLDETEIKKFIDNNVYFDKRRLNELLLILGIAKDVDSANDYTSVLQENKRLLITLDELFELEKNTSSVVSLAHPTKYFKNINEIEDFILMLKNNYNLRCVEVITSRAQLDMQSELKEFCIINNLYISGGSDYHGNPVYKNTRRVGFANKNILKEELTIFDLLKQQ